MLDWVTQNADAISALTSAGVLVVWAVYASLFYISYSRRNRPRIVIDQMSGPGTEASCVVTNLSDQPLYLECVLALAWTKDRSFGMVVTQHVPLESTQSKREIVSQLNQGPLEPGQIVIVGKLNRLAEMALETSGEGPRLLGVLQALEIRVVTMTSAQDRPMGALKRFRVNFIEGRSEWQSARFGTVQLRSHRARRIVRDWLTQAGARERQDT